jgi:hypothetical protein
VTRELADGHARRRAFDRDRARLVNSSDQPKDELRVREQPESRLQAAALGELFDFLENQRRLVGCPGVLMPPAHLGKRGVPLFRRWKPVQPVPLRPKKLTEGIAGRKAHADPIGTQLLDWRNAEVLRLTDTHSRESLRCGVAASQADGGPTRGLSRAAW